MFDLAMLAPLFRFASDIGKIMISDDKKDLAFPTRSGGRHRLHHFHSGIMIHGFALTAAELLDIYGIVKREQYKPTDTPQTFLKRVIQIHNKTYDPRDDINEEAERLEMLTKYFNSLTAGVNNKEKFEKKYRQFMHQKIPNDVIYGGKIKLKSQQQDSRPPIRPPQAPGVRNQIKLYKPNK